MFPTRILLAGALCAVALSAQAAGNATAGAKKVFQCQGCHGIADWKTAFPELYRVPKLGGQKPAYLVAAMKALEPMLNDAQHAQPTSVLVEMTAYNVMRLLHELQAERARLAFHTE